jgi:hypothetical protein
MHAAAMASWEDAPFQQVEPLENVYHHMVRQPMYVAWFALQQQPEQAQPSVTGVRQHKNGSSGGWEAGGKREAIAKSCCFYRWFVLGARRSPAPFLRSSRPSAGAVYDQSARPTWSDPGVSSVFRLHVRPKAKALRSSVKTSCAIGQSPSCCVRCGGGMPASLHCVPGHNATHFDQE